MKQKCCSLQRALLILIVICSALPMFPYSYDFCLNGIYFNITSNNTLCVTRGTTNYTDHLVIPKNVTYGGVTYTVTAINDWGFWECTRLLGVYLPSTITEIGDYAFGHCTRLTTVGFSNNITHIGNGTVAQVQYTS